MNVAFKISALPLGEFTELFSLSDDELRAQGAQWVTASVKPGYPCRVSLQDAEVGERLLLLPYCHQPVASPYRASGPIYVRELANRAEPGVGEVPELLRRRLLSFRAYDSNGMMVDAEVVQGSELETVVDSLFSNQNVVYIHVHNAKPGCYSCRIDRAE